jgi:hypothetical protein
MIPVGGLQMAKRSYSCSGSSNGNNNAGHLRHSATHGNGSASDGEDDHRFMLPPALKLLKSNGLQLRNAENKQEVWMMRGHAGASGSVSAP